MQRFIGLFLLTCFSWAPAHAQDSLAAIVYPDSVLIRNIGVDANCASRFSIDITMPAAATITMTETDTAGPLVNCVCTFDLAARLTALAAGSYTVNVYRQFLKIHHYQVDTSIFIGSIGFEIVAPVGGTGGAISHQSNCYHSGPVVVPGSDAGGQGFGLEVNYPNPFNPATTIRYFIPKQADVLLDVVDAAGKRVAVLVNERKEPGSYAVSFDGKGLAASGMYVYRLRAGDVVITRKMLLLK